jgi:hypothetical protein
VSVCGGVRETVNEYCILLFGRRNQQKNEEEEEEAC